jgi:ABC-2 type transport system permease protein
MHCVFTPIVATAGVISEEKEKNTLRVLIMSNVSLKEYLGSIGGFILIATVLSGSVFLFISDQTLETSLFFLLFLSIGCLVSIILGTCIGLYSKNTGAANGLAVPFGMLFAFMPMLSSFNEGIEKISRFTYGQQISYLLSGKRIDVFGIIIICLNATALLGLSALLYKKSLSEE